MRNYLIGIFTVGVIFLSSFIYKESRKSNFDSFPLKNIHIKKTNEPVLYLFLFFSKKNCHDCLEIIETLNNLPNHFYVTGIVPVVEMEDEVELRTITRAEFYNSIGKLDRNFC